VPDALAPDFRMNKRGGFRVKTDSTDAANRLHPETDSQGRVIVAHNTVQTRSFPVQREQENEHGSFQVAASLLQNLSGRAGREASLFIGSIS